MFSKSAVIYLLQRGVLIHTYFILPLNLKSPAWNWKELLCSDISDREKAVSSCSVLHLPPWSRCFCSPIHFHHLPSLDTHPASRASNTLAVTSTHLKKVHFFQSILPISANVSPSPFPNVNLVTLYFFLEEAIYF